MCNPITVRDPGRLLARGTHLGYEYEVTMSSDLAFRCGYVRIPPGHPWHGRDAYDIDAWVHGGLNFAEPDIDCGKKGGKDNAWWLGFFSGHAGDAPDPELPGYLPKLIPDDLFAQRFVSMFEGWPVRTTGYMIEQCHLLIEQAADVKAGRANVEIVKMNELRELTEKMLAGEDLDAQATG